MQKFLVIQTAFIGDVVLATALIEKLHQCFPDAKIDFLVRKGNEALLAGHPWLNRVLVWNKKEGKLKNLWKMGGVIRREKYEKVINVQRFAATGLLTTFSGAKETIGFDKNPLSRFFSKRVPHVVGGMHEVDRNQKLIQDFTDGVPAKPRLYPTAADEERVRGYKVGTYITVSPASVWFTKQYPREKWVEFLKRVPEEYGVYLLGGPGDRGILGEVGREVVDLSGQLSFLQSAALMKGAVMNYVNDSAPMHFASSVNAPVTAVYCSTVPSFGFGPLSDERNIVEVKEKLDCRPCGLHGYRACPKGHFNCAYKIEEGQLLQTLER
ncbi:MAG: glycosyltransferase family 9 protein [Bacteroidetes bacterium]|nr:glycosyltransferase family 9 protein [Bacteroidota bacterium]